jgi:hypothetical protein
MIKSRRMTRAGHKARMGIRGMHIEFWWERQTERDHWEELDVGGEDNTKMDLREIGWGDMG